ncbi:MAG TPA: ChbG/HpnK family deacetylase [Aquabacterium sp.]|nr:ChbG/HpnK family deacetylase [Aquabacterium sp.]
MSGRRLAICVDDFGLHAGVNAAVLELMALGRISATSCLVDGPSWPEAAPALKAAAYALDPDGQRQADVGLHLNLTECLDPQAQAGWTARPVGRLIRQAYARRLDPHTLRGEIARQWDRFVAIWGQVPDFVDGHQHVHQLPQVREALIHVMRSKLVGVSNPPWVRCCRAPAWRLGAEGTLMDAFKAWIIERLGAERLADLVREQGWRSSQHLLGVYPFDADADGYARRWQGWLRQAAEHGDVLMCHPAQPVRATAVESDPIAASRAMEFQVLTSPDWAVWLERAGVQVSRLE